MIDATAVRLARALLLPASMDDITELDEISLCKVTGGKCEAEWNAYRSLQKKYVADEDQGVKGFLRTLVNPVGELNAFWQRHPDAGAAAAAHRACVDPESRSPRLGLTY